MSLSANIMLCVCPYITVSFDACRVKQPTKGDDETKNAVTVDKNAWYFTGWYAQWRQNGCHLAQGDL